MTKAQAKKRIKEARAKLMKTIEGEGFKGAPSSYLTTVFKLCQELDKLATKLE